VSEVDLLRRRLAPILPEAWSLIDQEATRVLQLNLAGRKLVDFRGPYGWDLAAVSSGRLEELHESPAPQVKAATPRSHALLDLQAPLRLSLTELDAVGRGATNPDLRPVTKAAEATARAEDSAIFNGFAPAGIAGILSSSPHPTLTVKGASDYPRVIVAALELLRHAGISGPYALVLGMAAYDEVLATVLGGYPLLRVIETQLAQGPIVRATAFEGGAVLSTRGGDFELTVGHDLAMGFAQARGDEVDLFLTESLTFRVLEPAAAVTFSRAG
jgi:uncharacterized linocin/CFP29 family protein